MKDENGNFAKAISAALKAGEKVVVVHGGGPQIDAALKAKGIVSTWVGGFRVTTKEIFDVVEEVLVNQVGNEVAATLGKAGIKAHAMSARTLPTVIASRRTQLIDGTPADLGFVGNVTKVNPSALLELIDRAGQGGDEMRNHGLAFDEPENQSDDMGTFWRIASAKRTTVPRV